MSVDIKTDRRLNAYRADLADRKLKGRISVENYVGNALHLVSAPVAPMHRKPDPTSMMESQALMGETVKVFEIKNGWCWGQLQSDGYVGYLPQADLCTVARASVPSHVVQVHRSFVYPEAELRDPPLCALSLGAAVQVTGQAQTRGTDYVLVTLPNGDEGTMIAKHLRALDNPVSDWVSLCEQYLHVPYLWGGRSSVGLDCSALLQVPRLMAHKPTLRDSDMQSTMGTELELKPDFGGLQRGDLIFWPGHVAIMIDESNIIHANGHHMSVEIEPLAQAEARIAAHYGKISGARRPD
ncbi:MAG: C40 family peptidase [Rhizobiales bacterium]|nr:C40 family peptidase [Hyphomicrobiales bacterium]